MRLVASSNFPLLAPVGYSDRVPDVVHTNIIEGFFDEVGPGVIVGVGEPMLLIVDGEAALAIEP